MGDTIKVLSNWGLCTRLRKIDKIFVWYSVRGGSFWAILRLCAGYARGGVKKAKNWVR